MTTRYNPMWDKLRRRELLEQLERKKRRYEHGRVKLRPEFLTKKPE